MIQFSIFFKLVFTSISIFSNVSFLIKNKAMESSGLLKVNSVKKACVKCKSNALRFTYKNLKSCKPHEKKQKKTIKMLNLLVKNWKLRVWCYIFFMWFARFQILVCESQSIWRNVLVLCWLYHYIWEAKSLLC